MALRWVFLLSFVTITNGMDQTKLWRIPTPQSEWHLNLGRWFVQFQSTSCSWSGAKDLTDNEFFVRRESNTKILFTSKMRNGLCNKIMYYANAMSTKGVYTINDPMGSGFSGHYVLPVPENKFFVISYGCTKMSVNGDRCEDAGIYIMTRMIYPDNKVIAMINDALVHLWGITVDQLQRISHTNPCSTKKPYNPYRI